MKSYRNILPNSSKRIQMTTISSDMALSLGKRKRRVEIDEPSLKTDLTTCHEISDDLHALFREHFETQFEPLDNSHLLRSKNNSKEPLIDTGCSETDWEGLSDEERTKAHVIQLNSDNREVEEFSKEEFKNFMVLDDVFL